MSLKITGTDPDKSYTFLNRFEDECYVWMTELWLNPLSKSSKILEILITQANLKNLKNYLSNNIRQSDQDNLELWKESFNRNKSKYLPPEHLKVFQQNRRLNWFAIHVLLKQQKDIRISELNFSDPYLFLLYLIYIRIHPLRLDEHIHMLTKIREEFNEILEGKNNLNKYIEDPNFIEWAYSYLQSHRDLKRDYPDAMRFPIDSPQNKKDYILSIFDFNFYNDNREKTRYTLAINSLKKAWQQKSFRDKGGLKQPYHVPLTKTAKSELKKLAEFKNKTEGILLSELIHKAYLTEMCDENGKALY